MLTPSPDPNRMFTLERVESLRPFPRVPTWNQTFDAETAKDRGGGNRRYAIGGRLELGQGSLPHHWGLRHRAALAQTTHTQRSSPLLRRGAHSGVGVALLLGMQYGEEEASDDEVYVNCYGHCSVCISGNSPWSAAYQSNAASTAVFRFPLRNRESSITSSHVAP